MFDDFVNWVSSSLYMRTLSYAWSKMNTLLQFHGSIQFGVNVARTACIPLFSLTVGIDSSAQVASNAQTTATQVLPPLKPLFTNNLQAAESEAMRSIPKQRLQHDDDVRHVCSSFNLDWLEALSIIADSYPVSRGAGLDKLK